MLSAIDAGDDSNGPPTLDKDTIQENWDDIMGPTFNLNIYTSPPSGFGDFLWHIFLCKVMLAKIGACDTYTCYAEAKDGVVPKTILKNALKHSSLGGIERDLECQLKILIKKTRIIVLS